MNPLLIIEDMKLSNAPTALMNVMVSPLLYQQADGSPVSVWGNLELYSVFANLVSKGRTSRVFGVSYGCRYADQESVV